MSEEFIQSALAHQEGLGLLRTLTPRSCKIDFASNDYFGFAKSLKSIMEKEVWVGATGSRLLTGNHLIHEELEEEVAQFHGAKSGLLYTSGYTANLGLIAALGKKEVTFLYDLEVHASMIDGMKLSKASKIAWRHNDLNSLERGLKKASFPCFVLVESLYSISGSLAPLQEIVMLCAQYGAELIVDEAHATGVYGPRGEGRVFELGLESQVFARIHTFSKALGTHGACVVGSKYLREYLINFSRAFIYTTALPPSSLFLVKVGYQKLLQEGKKRQERLYSLISYFQDQIGKQSAPGPIQPIYFPSPQKVKSLAHTLQTLGVDVRAITFPTTKRGRECLRIVLHAFNKEEEIDQVVRILFQKV